MITVITKVLSLALPATTTSYMSNKCVAQDTSRIAKGHRRAAVGHWVPLLRVVGWLILDSVQDGDYLQLIGQYSTVQNHPSKIQIELMSYCN